jgi:hypothetical protein
VCVEAEHLVDKGNGVIAIERKLRPITREHLTKRQVSAKVAKVLEIRLKKSS